MCDYDLFISETVLPLTALALERLGKVMARQNAPNNNSSSSNLKASAKRKGAYRFQPLSWVGQFMMRQKSTWKRLTGLERQNGKGVPITPDSCSFGTWVDYEKGRREILRKKPVMNKVFSGFIKGGKV